MMSLTSWLVPARLRGLVVGLAVVAGVASLAGMVVGLVLVDGISDEFERSLGLSESALSAVDETLTVVEGVTDELDGGLSAAAESISGASQAGEDISIRLGEVAAFLDGELQGNLEALRQSMPAAIQAAAAIDDTLSALALFGVDYNPDEPFDVSLMTVQDALDTLPEQLDEQAAAIRTLVPVASDFAEDAGVLAESLASLESGLESSRELIESYRATLDEARAVVGDTGSGLVFNVWLLRALIVVAALVGLSLAAGLALVARLVPEVAMPVVTTSPGQVLDVEPPDMHLAATKDAHGIEGDHQG